MPLSNIVNVQITRETQSVSQAGFGSLMVLGTNKNWNDLIKQYANLQEVAADFNSYDSEYIAAQDFFSQPITPPLLYIGRRTVDSVGIDVETAMAGKEYTATINGNDVTINSTTNVQDSVVTLTGIMTYTITFSTDFNSGTTAITPTVNGVTLAPTAWTSNQVTTIAAVATVIGAASGVTSSTSSGDVITVVFAASATATVNSCTVAGTGSQPTVVIANNGPLVASNAITVAVNGTPLSGSPFTYASTSLATMTTIANAIKTYLNTTYSPGIANAVVSGVNHNILTITSNPYQGGVVTTFSVASGSSQATAAIVNTAQPTDKNTIADALAAAINAFSPSLPVTASVPDAPDGTLTIVADVSGVPFTLVVSTNITNPSQARVRITQVKPNQAYTVLINGTPFIYQAPNNVSSNAQIAAGLVDLINAPTTLVPVTASDNADGSFEVLGNANAAFLIQATPLEVMAIQKGLIIQPYVPSASVVDDLTAIQAVNNDWYALALTDRTVATVEAVASWIETQIKIFGTASDDTDIIDEAAGVDTTSIAALFNNAGYVRTFVLYHEEAADDYPECAWFGNCLPFVPGSETWMFKTLNSISYSTLSSTQEANAFAKSANTYEYVGGVGITQRGTMAQGEYIDIIRGVDWLTSTIQTLVYAILVNSPKIPYTDSGITAIEGQIRKALQMGVTNNFIAQDPPYQIFVPLASAVPSVDKANRILRNVKFQATLAGAIQAVNITGTVRV